MRVTRDACTLSPALSLALTMFASKMMMSGSCRIPGFPPRSVSFASSSVASRPSAQRPTQSNLALRRSIPSTRRHMSSSSAARTRTGGGCGGECAGGEPGGLVAELPWVAKDPETRTPPLPRRASFPPPRLLGAESRLVLESIVDAVCAPVPVPSSMLSTDEPPNFRFEPRSSTQRDPDSSASGFCRIAHPRVLAFTACMALKEALRGGAGAGASGGAESAPSSGVTELPLPTIGLYQDRSAPPGADLVCEARPWWWLLPPADGGPREAAPALEPLLRAA